MVVLNNMTAHIFNMQLNEIQKQELCKTHLLSLTIKIRIHISEFANFRIQKLQGKPET